MAIASQLTGLKSYSVLPSSSQGKNFALAGEVSSRTLVMAVESSCGSSLRFYDARFLNDPTGFWETCSEVGTDVSELVSLAAALGGDRQVLCVNACLHYWKPNGVMI